MLLYMTSLIQTFSDTEHLGLPLLGGICRKSYFYLNIIRLAFHILTGRILFSAPPLPLLPPCLWVPFPFLHISHGGVFIWYCIIVTVATARNVTSFSPYMFINVEQKIAEASQYILHSGL